MVDNGQYQGYLKGLREIGFSSENFFALREEIKRKSRILLLLSIIWLTIIGSLIVEIFYIAGVGALPSFLLLIFLYSVLVFQISILANKGLFKRLFNASKDFTKSLFLNIIISGLSLLPLAHIGNFAIIYLPIPVFILATINTKLMTDIVDRNPTGFVANILRAREVDLNDQKENLAYQLYDSLRMSYSLPASKTQLKIVDWPMINAMTVSGSGGDNLIILTRGAVEKLEYHELENVLAHEFSHIVNRDSELMTKLVIISGVALVLAWYLAFYLPNVLSNRSSGRRDDSDVDVLAIIISIVGIVFYILTPFIMSKIISETSKLREYLADMNAVRKTNYPPGMINALIKVAYDKSSKLTNKNEILGNIKAFFTSLRGYQRNRVPYSVKPLLFYSEIDSHPKIWQRIYLICWSTKTPLPPQFYDLKKRNI